MLCTDQKNISSAFRISRSVLMYNAGGWLGTKIGSRLFKIDARAISYIVDVHANMPIKYHVHTPAAILPKPVTLLKKDPKGTTYHQWLSERLHVQCAVESVNANLHS